MMAWLVTSRAVFAPASEPGADCAPGTAGSGAATAGLPALPAPSWAALSPPAVPADEPVAPDEQPASRRPLPDSAAVVISMTARSPLRVLTVPAVILMLLRRSVPGTGSAWSQQCTGIGAQRFGHRDTEEPRHARPPR